MRYLSSLIVIFAFMSSGRAAGDSSGIETIRQKYNIPGLTATYIKNGEVKQSISTGLKKIGTKAALGTDDKFHLGSCSKSMTSTLAGKLIELGYLDWDSKLIDLLPNIKLHKKLRDVTFELLLAHRSGLVENTEYFSRQWYDHFLDSGVYSARMSRSFLAQEVLTRAPKYTPLIDFKYSNMGYMIASHILEELTNSNFENLIKKYVFTPLNMNSCGLGPVSNPNYIFPKQPWGHLVTGKIIKAVHDDNPPAYGPAGAIHCSLKDWGKYLNEHVKGFNNESAFLLKSTFDKLHQKYPALDNDYTYGGWIRLERSWAGGVVLHHTGTNTYNFANTWVAPLKKSIYMSTANIGTNGSQATNSAIEVLLKLGALSEI